MQLWRQWLNCVKQLRPACGRGRTFLWMVLVLAGLSTRPERAGVTSLVRVLDLRPEAYARLLHLFRSTALCLDRLTELWIRMALRLFQPVMAGPYRICLVDGIKTAKEGKKMPAVKKLHQSSGSNTKAPYIMGHSFEAVSLLVRGIAGQVAAVPLVARIHEGLIWSNRDKRSLLDKMVALFLSLTESWADPVLLIADAYYASRKVILPLLKAGHHLLTRARSNSVAYFPASPPKTRRRGRPKLYGKKVRLKDLAGELSEFSTAPSPCYSDSGIELSYRCIDLLWKPVGKLVRFVIVRHPQRGMIFLLSTNRDFVAEPVIRWFKSLAAGEDQQTHQPGKRSVGEVLKQVIKCFLYFIQGLFARPLHERCIGFGVSLVFIVFQYARCQVQVTEYVCQTAREFFFSFERSSQRQHG